MIQQYEQYFFLIMLIIFLNDLKSNFKNKFSINLFVIHLVHHLLAIIQRCQPDLKSKYEADFQTSLKDYTKWYCN